MQDLSYRFDSIGNLVRRANKNIARNGATSVTEAFQYDIANRLTDILENGITQKQFTYDKLGNITFNSDVGNYHYANANKPHRLTSIDPIKVSGATVVAGDANADKRIDGLDTTTVARQILGLQANNPAGKADCNQDAGVSLIDVACVSKKITASVTGSAIYQYDLNGNITSDSGSDRYIIYTSFNKPKQIDYNGASVRFDYGPSRSRYKQVMSGTEDQTVYYLNGIEYIDDRKKGEQKYKVYINAGGRLVAIKTYSNKKATETRFVHRDHMGSIDTLTDEYGTVVERIAYDAFGKVRPLVKQVGTSGELSTFTLTDDKSFRGFTGHEHLAAVGLIHMNGRVYDPTIGRFLSADPYVQFPQDTQSYNRYAYVLNNPLSYTDPSGYVHRKIMSQVFNAAFGAAFVAITGGIGASVIYAVQSARAGGSFVDILGSAIRSYILGQMGVNVYAQAVIGGLISKQRGGSFEDGFVDAMLASFFSAAFSGEADAVDNWVDEITFGLVGGGATQQESFNSERWNGAVEGALRDAAGGGGPGDDMLACYGGLGCLFVSLKDRMALTTGAIGFVTGADAGYVDLTDTAGLQGAMSPIDGLALGALSKLKGGGGAGVGKGLSKPDFFTGKLRWKKQELHLKGTAPSNKSFLNSKADAQAVLNEAMLGQGTIKKIVSSENRFYFRSNKISGTYVNQKYGVQATTNLFMIKGKGQSSVVPVNPLRKF